MPVSDCQRLLTSVCLPACALENFQNPSVRRRVIKAIGMLNSVDAALIDCVRVHLDDEDAECRTASHQALSAVRIQSESVSCAAP